MKYIIRTVITLAFILIIHNMHAMVKPPRNDNALVKVVIANQSGICIMASTIGQGEDPQTVGNFSRSDAFTLQEYIFDKTKFNCNKLRLSSSKGVYELITWLKRNGSVHVDVNLNSGLVEKIKNIPVGSIITFQVNSDGTVRHLKQ